MDPGEVASLYLPEYAERFMCVPACINMILRRRNLPTLSQESIARELDLVVPLELAGRHPWARLSDKEADWGVHPQTTQASLSSFFHRHCLPIQELFYRPSSIFGRDYADFIATNLALDNDLIVGYDYASVFGAGSHAGHVSLVVGVERERDLIHLVDPEQPTAQLTASLEGIVKGSEARRDGFWVIGPTEGLRRCQELY
jgi:hypothetical protein